MLLIGLYGLMWLMERCWYQEAPCKSKVLEKNKDGEGHGH